MEQKRNIGSHPLIDAEPFDFSVKASPIASRGRGARSNAVGRYESEQRVWADDGWGGPEEWQADGRAVRTTETADSSRTIIARNQSPDVPFDSSINVYRGCEHGCIYCFARPTHAYLGLSPGLDFETRLFFKPDAPKLLARELRLPGWKPQVIAMGTNTDPYQPIEKKHRLTRRLLKVLRSFSNPVGIVTKSALVTRDADILADMAALNLAKVALSVTTLDAGLARRMEPRASTPARRLAAIETLAKAGIPVGVMAAPMIPGLNDAELESILTAARDAGATEAGYITLRLPLEIKDLFAEWLATEAPDRAGKIMKLIRDIRAGRVNDPRFGTRMTGTGVYADLLRQRYHRAVRHLGLNERRLLLDASRFSPPPRAGDQMSLL